MKPDHNSVTKFSATLRGMLSLIVLCAFLLPSLAWADSDDYVFPVENPLAATIVGTPERWKASLPREIPVKELELKVFEDRTLPDILWYDKALRYSLAYQKHAAPLIIVIAGTGSGHNSPNMQVLQRTFYQAGFHVLSLPSPTHPNFIASASQSSLPGHPIEDAKDLYRVMELAQQQVRKRIDVTEFYLTGYSLGALQAAFVSKLNETKQVFKFKKVLLINPPMSLYNSSLILDAMLVENIPGGMDNTQQFFDRLFQVFSKTYQRGDFVDFSRDFLYTTYQQESPKDEGLATLIGMSFRLSTASLVFTSDVMTNAGYIKPKNLNLSPTDSMTDYFKVSARVSLLEYFDGLLYPYFVAKRPGLTRQQLLDELSLKSLAGYLSGADNIALVHNEDDVILAPGELDSLREIFGTRAKIYPLGGHMGNLAHKDNVAYLAQFFGAAGGAL